MMKQTTRCTRPQYVCANEKVKLIGGIDGYFPDFGHHLENEMGGLWLYPVKLLDGFWMHFTDHSAKTVACYMKADEFDNYPHKNEFSYGGGLGHTTVTAKRTQIAPEGLKGIKVTYEFVNNGAARAECSTEFLARVNLRPVWLAEELSIYDGEKDEIAYLEEADCYLAKDCANPWYAAIACEPACDERKTGDYFGPEYTKGNGVSCVMAHHFCLEPGAKQVITFYIAGSDCEREEALEQLEKLRGDADFEKEKADKYAQLVKRCRIHVGDAEFENIFDWVKVNTDWLILDHDKFGRGLMAGLPEYPWWFGCDSFYSLQGILGMGDFTLCRDTLKLLLEYSENVNGNGRIVHEILPDGYCPNPGNTQETAHFVTMVWKYYDWTGDLAFLKSCLSYIRKSIAWLKEQDDDGDLFPSGYGIIEIAGLNMEMIDTAVYTCEAYGCYSKMLELLGEPDAAEEYQALYRKTKEAINEALWDERAGLYCDAYASYDTIHEKKDVILEQLKYSKSTEIRDYILNLMEERSEDGKLEKGWLLNRNWVINTPMEIGIAPRDKADRALLTMRSEDYIGEYGMYLDALKQNAEMTISTGVMAVAQVMYGYADEALRLIEKMFGSFSKATPGSISEMSPDYGCFTQAWTVYAVFLPVVRFFFGIEPKASEKKIVISPCLPSRWENAKISDVKVLDGAVSVHVEKQRNRGTLTVKNTSSFPVELRLGEECRIEEQIDAGCIHKKEFVVHYTF